MDAAPPTAELSPAKLKLLAVLVAAVILSPMLVIAVAVLGTAGGGPPVAAAVADGTGEEQADATLEPVPPQSPGERLYASCVACHGPEGAGVAALGGPAIAGQEAWYLERQLQAFRQGWRGTHPEDVHGQQMAPMAGALPDDAAVTQLAAHIAAQTPPETVDPVPGTADPARGAAFWATCATCHGPEAGGMEPFGAPRLTAQHGWYLERQILNYRRGIRGTHPEDAYGQMMAPMAQLLPDEQAVKDLVAYLQSLDRD